MQTKTILLVDDEHSIRDGLSKILSAENYQVVLAENGQEAIEKHGTERIDLLLLGLDPPVKDGWAALNWLADVNPLLPVIIITGRSNQRALAEALGADLLMEKPLDVPLLLQSVSRLLRQPLENRAQRASSHQSSFRYVPYDHDLFRDMLLKRIAAPIPCPVLPAV